MCLRFVFLLALRVPAWPQLSRRSSGWKDAEILLLRHRVARLECRRVTRPKLTWADRALFAALPAVMPRACHGGFRFPVAPATILRWHRDLVKRRWVVGSRRNSPGRPRRHGIDPAPRRGGPRWAAFLRSQAGAIIACDLFTVNLLDGTKACVMAVIGHATGCIHVLGATAHSTRAWVTQQVRSLLLDLDASADRIKFLMRDRGILYPPELEHVLSDAGITAVRSAVRAPRMNAIMERWIGGCRRELFDRTLIWNLPHLRRILCEYETYHNTHRPHMALGSAAPDKLLPAEVVDLDAFRARRHDRIGGVIREYHPAA